MSVNDENAQGSERLAKRLARAGLASRRQAEAIILAGRVSVNGELVNTPAFNVSDADKVAVDGKLISKPPLRLWLYHKPKGLVTSARDEKGRKTIYDELPAMLKEVRTIGRLDLNSEGLLLLTNDGELKRRLELPETGWRRKYRVRAFGEASETSLELLRSGVKIDGERFRPMEIMLEHEKGDNRWYSVGLREGRNREIRRAFEHIGLKVNRLIRVSYGPFQLGALGKGEISEMKAKALKMLLGGLLPEGAELGDQPLALVEDDAKKGVNPKPKFKPHPQKRGDKASKQQSRKKGRK